MNQKLAIQKLNQLKDKGEVILSSDYLKLKNTTSKKSINIIIEKYNLRNV